MADFEYLLVALLIPALYVMVYIAGKYDLLALICKMLEERLKEIEEEQKGGGTGGCEKISSSGQQTEQAD